MKFLLFLSLVSTVFAVTSYEVVREEWEAWKLTNNRFYSSVVEETFRMRIFIQNKAKIARHNR